jgi:hypothetical protein
LDGDLYVRGQFTDGDVSAVQVVQIPLWEFQLLIGLAVGQFALTVIAVTVDLAVVFRLVWLGIIRQMKKGDWLYLGKFLARFAEREREDEQAEARRKAKREGRA